MSEAAWLPLPALPHPCLTNPTKIRAHLHLLLYPPELLRKRPARELQEHGTALLNKARLSFTGKQLNREETTLVYHLLKLGKHALSGSNLHIYLGNWQTASSVWFRHSYSKDLCTGITLFFHILSVKISPRPSSTLHYRLWPLLQFTPPLCFGLLLQHQHVLHSSLFYIVFSILLLDDFYRICSYSNRNSTQTIFSWTVEHSFYGWENWKSVQLLSPSL